MQQSWFLVFAKMNATPSASPLPRRLARYAALAVAVATIGFWAAKDGRLGWSQDRVPVKQIDEITGLEHVTYEDRYVPGVDFLGGGLGISALLLVVSFFVRQKSNSTT